jgi:hypothetical protein
MIYDAVFCSKFLHILSSLVHLNVNAICSSQNVQTVLSFIPCVFQHQGRQRSNFIVDSCTKFNHTVNFWTEYLILYINWKDKIHWTYIRGVGDQGIGLSCPSHLFRKVLFGGSHCKAQCGGAPSCWKKTFGWKYAICGAANNPQQAVLESFMNQLNFVSVYWRPAYALLMLDTTCLLKLFRPSLDGLPTSCIFYIFLMVTSLIFALTQSHSCLTLMLYFDATFVRLSFLVNMKENSFPKCTDGRISYEFFPLECTHYKIL